MYARQFGEEVLTFGVSGKLTLSAMIMYDHQTDSLWAHFTGEAITGKYQGTQLEVLPAMQTTWGHWRELHPDSQVLAWRMPTAEDPSGALGFTYDPYLGYYASGWAGYGRVRDDDRLDQKDFVLGLIVNDRSMAYAFNDLVDHPVVNDTVGGRDLVVTYEPVSDTAAAFVREVDGRSLTFSLLEEDDAGGLLMVDQETNSRWLLLTAEAIDGPLKGTRLDQLPANYSFWFAWADWNPTTGLFLEEGDSP